MQSHEAASRNDYDLKAVMCPGTYLSRDGRIWPCPNLIDRREVGRDRAIHEYKCPRCLCLYMYRLDVDGNVVIISIQHPPPKRGDG